MITSGKILEQINEKIAVLKNEISQAGKLGILNIHKFCENLVKNLLNVTYDYQMVNLNDPITNFPGIDIGDEIIGIAYQVSSEKTSAKVDEMLDKIIRYKHYQKFPTIKMFVLSPKQATYTLTANFNGLFTFDINKNIVDFDDWLKDMQHLPLERLQKIIDFLEDELPYAVSKLKGQETIAAAKATTIINTEASLKNSKMSFFQHSVIRMHLLGKSFSAPILFQALDKFYEGVKKNNLYLFNPVYSHNQTAQQIDFYDKLNNYNVANYFKEGALRIQANTIIFEKASYESGQFMLTNLNTEVLAILTLLIFFKQLYGNQTMQVEFDFDLASNGKLCFFSNGSQLHVSNLITTTVLNPSPLSFSKVIHNISNGTLNDIYTELIHGFVSEGQPGYFFQPFLELNEFEQNRSNTALKFLFAPSLKELHE